MMTKKSKIRLGLASLILFIMLGCTIWLNQQISTIENSRPVVKLVKPRNRTTTIFFYKDTCNQCQKIFSKIYFEKYLFKKNIQFVNLNQRENIHFISEFNLHFVPTFVRFNKGQEVRRYSGTNQEKIKQLL